MALLSTWLGYTYFGIPHILSSLLAVLVFGFILMPILERLFPYRATWNNNDEDFKTDILHLIFSNGVIPNIEKPVLIAALAATTAWLSSELGNSLWPTTWPLLVQLLLMLLIAELGRYWVHRAAHTIPCLWRLHAIHHSPNRLYFLNAGRFHPIEKVIFQLPEVVPFILLGTNIETIAMYATFNTIHGFFQHSNIKLRLGWLNYIFSMTELHRWHHSKLPAESDRNFGNNLIIWDLIFGTFFHPNRKEVAKIGLLNPKYPKGYMDQLKAPFASRDISKPENFET